MKVNPQISTLRHTYTGSWCGCLCSLALILGAPTILRAQTCPSDIEPPTPPQEQLAAAYQPSAYDPNDHTVLRRLRYSPDPADLGTTTTTVLHIGV